MIKLCCHYSLLHPPVLAFLFIVSFLQIVSQINFIGLDLKPMEVKAQAFINLNRLQITPPVNAVTGTGQGVERKTPVLLCVSTVISASFIKLMILMQKCKLL